MSHWTILTKCLPNSDILLSEHLLITFPFWYFDCIAFSGRMWRIQNPGLDFIGLLLYPYNQSLSKVKTYNNRYKIDRLQGDNLVVLNCFNGQQDYITFSYLLLLLYLVILLLSTIAKHLMVESTSLNRSNLIIHPLRTRGEGEGILLSLSCTCTRCSVSVS